MTTVSATHDATFYVQLKPTFSRWSKTPAGTPAVESVSAVAITQKRPDPQRAGTVVAKLTVRVPDAAFLPLTPEAVIVVPAEMTAAGQPIEVTAGPVGGER